MGDILRQLKYESILIFPYSLEKSRALVVGMVVKIEKGNELDIVYLNVGKGCGDGFTRKLVAKSVMVRKQLSTLKINTYTIAWCDMPRYKKEQKGEMVLNAIAFWGAYVPNHYDRLELENEQKEQGLIEKLELDKEEKIGGDWLSQFENEEL